LLDPVGMVGGPLVLIQVDTVLAKDGVPHTADEATVRHVSMPLASISFRPGPSHDGLVAADLIIFVKDGQVDSVE
jgi:hypothetical protein